MSRKVSNKSNLPLTFVRKQEIAIGPHSDDQQKHGHKKSTSLHIVTAQDETRTCIYLKQCFSTDSSSAAAVNSAVLLSINCLWIQTFTVTIIPHHIYCIFRFFTRKIIELTCIDTHCASYSSAALKWIRAPAKTLEHSEKGNLEFFTNLIVTKWFLLENSYEYCYLFVSALLCKFRDVARFMAAFVPIKNIPPPNEHFLFQIK